MELVKAESLNFCNACLCVGRTLYPIKDEKSKQFYLQALSEIPALCLAWNQMTMRNLLFDMTISPPAVCWECRLQLQRAVDFREQVKDSYRILVTYTSENLNECLLSDVSRPPRLKITHNDAINIEPIYTYELCDHCDVKNSPETHYDQGSKDSSIDVNRIQCTQRVFVKEEQCVKPELDGADIGKIYL